MENIKKIKQTLKTISKKLDFKHKFNFSINFENSNNFFKSKKSTITKIQFLNSYFSNIKKKNEIKFPLEIINFKSIKDIQQNLISKLGIIKLNSVIILNKNIFNKIELTQNNISSVLKISFNQPLKTQLLVKKKFLNINYK